MADKVTALDIAKRLSVSRSTVSRAFDPASRISPDLRRRILKLAHELGYRPTSAARLIMREYPHVIAVVVRDVTNPVRAAIMTRLIRELERNGYLPLVFQVPNARTISARIEAILSHLPSAVVMTGFRPPSSVLTLCSQRGTPTLILNRGGIKGLAANYITSDHHGGGLKAAEVLIARGCRNIAFVSGQSVNDPDASEERMRGFLAGLERVGMVACAAHEGDHSYDSGVRAAREFFAASTRPDGVFCGNDMMAMGFMDVARETFGLIPPDDYQLVGYDNIEMANWAPYRLSTIAQNMEAVIAATVRGVRQLVEKPDHSIRVVVPVKFIARNTTRETTAQE
ncbi:LacI family DNA-binding transcriptional regulator [Oricola thermophila]|uniref:LacI family DNA-binding transcriptional regulator n=1 Tax=Oricola thermophila TaxID=2742145 RepID=A0A6N1VGM7_9HYPH|nr:LacI family DNA-binding transcriptional regulator [Oricola thermophila]QKV20041.1 LacI family DNA-binding transcriptional regulator [Oricola thermophila]